MNPRGRCPVCEERFQQWAELPINGNVVWDEMYNVEVVCINRGKGPVGRIYAHGERL